MLANQNNPKQVSITVDGENWIITGQDSNLSLEGQNIENILDFIDDRRVVDMEHSWTIILYYLMLSYS